MTKHRLGTHVRGWKEIQIPTDMEFNFFLDASLLHLGIVCDSRNSLEHSISPTLQDKPGNYCYYYAHFGDKQMRLKRDSATYSRSWNLINARVRTTAQVFRIFLLGVWLLWGSLSTASVAFDDFMMCFGIYGCYFVVTSSPINSQWQCLPFVYETYKSTQRLLSGGCIQ